MEDDMKSSKLHYRTQPYVSDFEQYLDRYLSEHPTVTAAQQRGWQLWWDRRVSLDELVVHPANAVAVRGYQYD